VASSPSDFLQSSFDDALSASAPAASSSLWMIVVSVSAVNDLIAFPAHALLVVEERLREQEAEGVEMPASMERDELALRILITAGLRPPPSRP
jgi:hypothetical protein